MKTWTFSPVQVDFVPLFPLLLEMFPSFPLSYDQLLAKMLIILCFSLKLFSPSDTNNTCFLHITQKKAEKSKVHENHL